MSPKKEDYFPLKLAQGKQFCNRVEERQFLKNNIEMARHTVLVSPRRYGKSSLVHYVVNELNYPFVSIDLFLAHDDEAVTKRILAGISQAISQLMPHTRKALELIQKYFINFKITLAVVGFSIESSFSPGQPQDAVELIFELLRSLATLAKNEKKKIIFFIDEFQDIQNAKSARSIQGAIRHVAQETSDIVFIFSGSSRHLLLQIFDDSSKPLYMLCDKLKLDRISSNDYISFLQEKSQARWGENIDQKTLQQIFTLTELHSFYLNMLCHQLWLNNEKPIVESVKNTWDLCLDIESRRLNAEIEAVSVNQQKILKHLAKNPTKEPTGREALAAVKLSSSSMLQGIKALSDKDIIYKVKQIDEKLTFINKEQYRVLDPLLAYSLRSHD